MSRICQVTGKGPMVGNRVSHSNIKTKRRYLPNLQEKRFWLETEQRFVTIRLSMHGLRIINKRGVDVVVAEMRARGERIKGDVEKGE